MIAIGQRWARRDGSVHARPCRRGGREHTGEDSTGDDRARARTRGFPCGFALVLALAGCADDSLDDLHTFVELAPSDGMLETVAMEDAHDAVPAATMVVARNPFERMSRSAAGTPQADGPDPSRIPEPLEQHPVGRLQMVGTLAGRGSLYALVRDPNGRTYPATTGDYLGRDHGRIVTVHDDRVEFVELVADGTGWRRRPRSLAMETDDPAANDAGGS
ncbi:MAG: pilus assembly protein PilP [Gammaproteobacteria bacterium]|nr:pilus assembly protein PilP [Gammaproteobacteria bacterium]